MENALQTVSVLKERLREAEKGLEMYQEDCKHTNIEVSNSGLSAKCKDCGNEPRGWYCPESTNMGCEYECPITGESNFDECIYCGEPYERK